MATYTAPGEMNSIEYAAHAINHPANTGASNHSNAPASMHSSSNNNAASGGIFNRMSTRGTARLFVGQLNFDASEYDVRQIFSFYGHVLHVNILRDGEGKSSGSAFVTYGSTDEADTAIQSLHDHYSMGRDRPLQVSYCRRSEVISDFGYQHAVELRENNKSNPLPPQRA